MSSNEALANALDKARACVASLGTASYCTEVAVVTRVWSSGRIGKGEVTETVVVLAPRPRVTNVSPRSRYNEGGATYEGERLVRGVSLTYAETDLSDRDLPAGTERFYRLNGKDYRLVSEPICEGTDWRFRVARMRARPVT